MRARLRRATQAILLCTPNNPTGPALPHDAVIDFLDSVPENILVVLDEAYVEFVTDPSAVRGSGGAERSLQRRGASHVLQGLRLGRLSDRLRHRRAGVGRCRASGLIAVRCFPSGSGRCRRGLLAAEEELMVRVAELVKAAGPGPGLIDRGFDVPDAQGNFVWLPAGPRTAAYTEAFGAGGLAVRPFVAGDRPTGSGSPLANRRPTTGS